MEKAVLHLTGLTSSELNLAFSRLKRDELAVKRDIGTKHLLTLKRDIQSAIDLLASILCNQFDTGLEPRSHHQIVIIFAWLIRENEDESLGAINNALDKLDTRGWNTLRLVVVSNRHIRTLKSAELLSKLSHVVTNVPAPTAYALLARDAFWTIAVNIAKAGSISNLIKEHSKYLMAVLLSEAKWSSSDLLSKSLRLLVEILSEVVQARSADTLSGTREIKAVSNLEIGDQLLEKYLPSHRASSTESSVAVARHGDTVEPISVHESKSGADLLTERKTISLKSNPKSDLAMADSMIAPKSKPKDSSPFLQGENIPLANSLTQVSTAVNSSGVLNDPLDEAIDSFLGAHGFNDSLFSVLQKRHRIVEAGMVILEPFTDRLKSDDTDQITACVALRDVCLHIGRVHSASDVPVPIARSLTESAIRILNDSKIPSVYQQLAASLVSFLVSISSPPSSGVTEYSMFMPMLDDAKDGVSFAAVELIANSVYSSPASALGDLEVRLNAKEVHKRQNALLVLSRVIELRASLASRQRAHEDSANDDSVSPSEKALKRPSLNDPSRMDNALEMILLRRLENGDDSLDTRKLVSKACVFLPPKRILPRLCALLGNRNDNTRSAALEALNLMFRNTNDTDSCFNVLLIDMESIDDQMRCFDLASRWITSMLSAPDGEDRFDKFLKMLVDASFDRSHDNPHIIGLARRAAEFVVRYPSRAASYCQLVLSRWNEMTHSESLVNRLVPLLLLRVLPVFDLADETLQVTLFERVTHVIISAYQERELTGIACEVIARFPGAAPWSFFLEILEKSTSADSNLVRAALFGLCRLLSVLVEDDITGPDAFPLVAVRVVWGLLEEHKRRFEINDVGTNEDMTKFVLGVQEFMALACVCESLPLFTSTGETFETKDIQTNGGVQELSGKELVQVAPSSCSALDDLIQKLDHANDGWDGLVASGSLVMIAKSLSQNTAENVVNRQHSMVGLAMSKYAKNRDATVVYGRIASGFASIVSRAVISAWSKERRASEHELDVLFHCAFACGKYERSFLRQSELDMIVNALLALVNESTSATVKIASLKLLGVVLILPEKDLKSLKDGSLGRIRASLRGVENVDTSPEARSLASQLLTLSFGE